MRAEQSVFEQIYGGIGDALADIREKVVEEPWFGRAVTERGEAPQWPEAMEAEPQPGSGLNGEILGPEAEPMNTRDSAGFLEHGTVLDTQPMNTESPQWPEARQALTYDAQPEREQSPDMDIDR